jgi:tetratricopeptide (TPR) repeat protein
MIQLFLFAWLAGQAATSDAMRHVQAGLEARQQHNLEQEIAEFRKATEIDPSLADGFVNLGAAYMEKRDYGAAIVPLKRALELSPDLAVAHQFLGYALLAQGYAAEAIPHLDRVGAQEALGIARIETGQLTEAVTNFTAALAKRPADPDLLYYLGHASGLLSKTAIDDLIANYPKSARAHQALAENYYALRQMPQAEKEYLEALRLRPDLPDLHLELGQIYANPAQWPKAEAEFRAETKLQPVPYFMQGKANDALPELKRANELKPQMPETLYSLGKAASLAGDSATAEKAWLKVIDSRKTPRSRRRHTSDLPVCIVSKARPSKPAARCKSSRNSKTPSDRHAPSSQHECFPGLEWWWTMKIAG